MEYLTDRLVKILHVLKDDSLLGYARSTVTLMHQKYILLIFTYCCELFIIMSETFLQKLEVLLRFITGAPQTTPIDSTLQLTGIKPLGVVFEEMTILPYKKLMQTIVYHLSLAS